MNNKIDEAYGKYVFTAPLFTNPLIISAKPKSIAAKINLEAIGNLLNSIFIIV